MSDTKSIGKATPRRYNTWAGNPRGDTQDATRCIEEIHDLHYSHQCYRKRGFGKGGLYCKQHDPVVVAKRKQDKINKWDKKFKREGDAIATRDKRDKLARQLAVAIVDAGYGDLDDTWHVHPNSVIANKARQLLKLYEEEK